MIRFVLAFLCASALLGAQAQRQERIKQFESELQQDLSDSAKIKIHWSLIRLNIGLDSTKAAFSYMEAVKLSEKVKREDWRIQAIMEWAIFLEESGFLEEARAFHLKALQASEKMESDKLIGRSHENLGIFEKTLGNTAAAMQHYQQAAAFYQKAGHAVNQHKVLINAGVLYANTGDYDAALKNYLEALRFFETNDPAITGQIKSNIGVVFGYLGDQESALKYALEALQLRRELGDSFAIAQSLVNVSQVHINTQSYQAAIPPASESLTIFRNLGSDRGMSIALSNLANVYEKTGDIDQSIGINQETIALAKRSSDKYQLATSYVNIASNYGHQKQWRLAAVYLDSALEVANQIGSLMHKRYIYESKAEVAFQTGNYTEAYRLKDVQMAYQDSLVNEKNVESVNALKTQYETEKKEQEIARLQAEAEVKELQMAQTRILLAGIVVVALLLVLVVIFVNRQRRLRLQASVALEKEQLQKERFRAVMEAEESERKRMARELHDGLGQMLSTVRLYVSDVDDRQNVKIDRSLRVLDATIEEVRAISHNLMPRKLLDAGLPEALKDMAQRISESDKLKVEMKGAEWLSVDDHTAIALYRSIQEVVNNAIKYAHASQLVVDVTETQTGWQVTVADNGQGFNTENIAKSKGIGWSNIFSRMELIGGSVQIVSRPGEGTKVHLTIPRVMGPKKAAG